MLDRMFAPWILRSVSKYSDEQVAQYISDLEGSYRKRYNPHERPLLTHEALKKTIGENLKMMGWQVKYERLYADFDISYQFDIMARKRSRTIIVEVKPEFTAKVLDEVLPYLSNVELKIKETRVLFGTDILNFELIRNNRSILHILNHYAKKRRLGVLLADTKNAWLIPDEFITMLSVVQRDAEAA